MDIKVPIVSSVITELVFLPISVFKTNYYNRKGNTTQIMNSMTLKSYYRSIFISSFIQMCSVSSRYIFYQKMKQYVENKYVSGLITGIFVSFIQQPLQYIKINIQMQKGIKEITHQLFKNPLNEMKRGFPYTICKQMISGSTYMPIFDQLRQEGYTAIQSGIIASIFATSFSHPFDYLQSRKMYIEYQTRTLRLVCFRDYYRGLHINLFRVVPHFTFMMTLTENLKNRL